MSERPVTGQTREVPLEDRLRKWAKGDLPAMTAVEFLIMSEAIDRADELAGIIRADEHGAWLDPTALRTALNTGKLGYMSSGERATWRLIDSILSGLLNDAFWSLDPTRKAAFITALAATR